MTEQTHAVGPQRDSPVSTEAVTQPNPPPERRAGNPVVDELLGTLKAAMADLSSAAAGAENSITWGRVAAAAREVESRARRLAHLLEDHVAPMPARLGPFVGSTANAQVPDRFRVLVVDDEPEQAALLERVLSPWYAVRIAHDGLEAIELIRTETPDVVLTDLEMPKLGGLALLDLARSTSEALHVPLIVLSGRADTDAKVFAFEAGAFDFMTKPVAPNELVARIRNALAHSQVLRRERMLGGRDDLTGLANRRTFRTFLEGALRNAKLRSTPLALLLVDQDRLKQINDTWGHPVGDEALRTLGRALASSTRGSDCAARLGGDEFALVVPGCDRDGALVLLSRIEDTLRRSTVTLPDESTLTVEASFGIAAFGEQGDETAEQFLRRADVDLYQHKRARKRF